MPAPSVSSLLAAPVAATAVVAPNGRGLAAQQKHPSNANSSSIGDGSPGYADRDRSFLSPAPIIVGSGAGSSPSPSPIEQELRDADADDPDDDDEEPAMHRPKSTTVASYRKDSAGMSAEASSAKKRLLMLLSWGALIGSVLSMSATGPVFLYLQRGGVSPILACVWRNQCTMLVLAIPAWLEWRQLSAEERQWDAFRVRGSGKSAVARRGSREVGGAVRGSPAGQDWHAMWYMAGVALEWCCSLVLWVTALPYTTTARASLLTSVYPLLLVLWIKFGPSRGIVSTGEIAGVVVSFLGIVLSEVGSILEDPAAAATSAVIDGAPLPDSSQLLIGDLLCLFSAVFIAIDIVLSKRAREVVPLFTYSWITCLMTLSLLTFLSLVLEDTVLFSMDPVRGCFGWFSSTELVWLTVVFGVLEGLVGVLGFNFAVKYVPPLIFSSVQLLDPGITGLMSWGAGLEAFPTAATFLGIAVVSVGIGIVVVKQQEREEAAAAAGAGPDGMTRESPLTPGSKVQYQMINMHA